MPAHDLPPFTFGVELECYLPEGATQAAAAAAVSQRLGRAVVVETYNHRPRPHWKVVTDGSLNNYERGIEFVSPILRGEDGLRQVDVVCRALTDFGCTVNKNCGLHVHVGSIDPATSEPIAVFKNIVKLYSSFEPVIDSIMPVSRRHSANMYCRSMTTANPSQLSAAANLDAIIRVIGGRHGEGRHYKVNLTAWRRHRTIEFRQHSGTLDGNKACKWTVLCLRMVAAAKSDLAGLGVAPTVNQARNGSKAWKIGQMLLRTEGATGREICAAMGWPSVSVPAQARAAGLEVTSQRTGREVRYFAVSVAAPTSVPTTLEGFAQIIGASEEERGYLTQRASDLGGPVAWAA